MIHQWQPWKRSTGPRTNDGKAASAQNALKHGGRSAALMEDQKIINDLLKRGRAMLERAR